MDDYAAWRRWLKHQSPETINALRGYADGDDFPPEVAEALLSAPPHGTVTVAGYGDGDIEGAHLPFELRVLLDEEHT
jgi:hypothetical protein